MTLPNGHEGRAARKKNIELARRKYDESPKRCPQCDDPISWEMRNRAECCSRVCAGYRAKGLPYSKRTPRLCPNCDAQLPTWKIRNRGNGRVARRK